MKVSSSDIINGEMKGKMKAFDSSGDLVADLAGLLQKGDIVFTMGAGDVYKLKGEIIKIIDQK